MGENVQHLVDEEKVRKTKDHVQDLLSDPETENSGRTMKWVLEELDLWEEEEADHDRKASTGIPNTGRPQGADSAELRNQL